MIVIKCQEGLQEQELLRSQSKQAFKITNVIKRETMESETSVINTITMLTPEVLAGQFEKSMMTRTPEMKCKRGYRFYYPLRIPGGKGAYEVLQAPAVILERVKSFIKAAYFDETEKIVSFLEKRS